MLKILAMSAVFVCSGVLFAQGITVKSKTGTVENHGEAKPAERKESDALDRPDHNPNGEAVSEFIKILRKAQEGANDGSLNNTQVNGMIEEAMKKMQENLWP